MLALRVFIAGNIDMILLKIPYTVEDLALRIVLILFVRSLNGDERRLNLKKCTCEMMDVDRSSYLFTINWFIK